MRKQGEPTGPAVEEYPDADPSASGEEFPAEPLGPEELVEQVEEAAEVVEHELTALVAERDQYLDQLLRTRADLENFRKRMVRQQTEHLERAAEGLVEKLLEVLDNFDAALAHGEGFEQVYGTLVGILEKEGLQRIDGAGVAFDPKEHDAVAHDEGEVGADGPVVDEVLRAGYRFKGRLLRPAMVKVRG